MAEDLNEALGMNIPLSEMIETLRLELSVALARGKNQSVHFEVGDIDLELAIKITGGKKTGGGIKFWVVSADAKSDQTVGTTHKFALKLKPKLRGEQGPLEIASAEQEDPRLEKKTKANHSPDATK